MQDDEKAIVSFLTKNKHLLKLTGIDTAGNLKANTCNKLIVGQRQWLQGFEIAAIYKTLAELGKDVQALLDLQRLPVKAKKK